MKDFFKQLLTQIFTSQMRKIVDKHQPKIVCVVGSVGKSTTKIAIATVLKQKYRVQVQDGNYNTPISLPFVFTNQSMPNVYNPFGWVRAWWHGQKVLGNKYPFDVVVIELGTDCPGDIIAFGEFFNVDISVVTAISPEHMQNFANLEAVAQEELTIAEFSKMVVINNDDVEKSFVNKFVSEKSKIVSFGQNSGDYRYSLTQNSNSTLSVTLELKNKKAINVNTNIVAKHLAKSAAAAAVVADLMGLSQKAIKEGLIKIKPMSGRMQILRGIQNSCVIDDSYNSSPLAVKAALQTLYELKAPQKIAVLGAMNELGNFSKHAHEEIGKTCDPKELDLVITIGQHANHYLTEAARNKGCRVISCKNPYEAGLILAEQIRPRALVLVKGSQNGVFAEEAIKPILKNKNDIKLLVRQNRFWLRKKRHQFKGLRITS